MREGVSMHYDTYGDGATTVLLVPAWSIVRPWHRLRRHRLPDRGIELIRDRQRRVGLRARGHRSVGRRDRRCAPTRYRHDRC